MTLPFLFKAETVTETSAPATLVCDPAVMPSFAAPAGAGPTGVTGSDGADGELVPMALVAVTVNV